MNDEVSAAARRAQVAIAAAIDRGCELATVEMIDGNWRDAHDCAGVVNVLALALARISAQFAEGAS